MTSVSTLVLSKVDARSLLHRGLVWGGLCLFVASVYLALVFGPAVLLGFADRPGLGLSLLATSVVALGFNPARARLHRFASRIVFGHRQTPLESISDFSQRVSTALSLEETLPEIVRVIARGTGAVRASLWLRVGTQLVPAATWPPNGEHLGPVNLDSEALPPIPGADLAVPVIAGDELLGALAIEKRAHEPITSLELALVKDVSSQAALALRNARLAAELELRLQELSALTIRLRESRRLIVEAQDSERRRIERGIHDEAQQYLVAMVIQLERAKMLLDRDPIRAAGMIPEMKSLRVEVLGVLSRLSSGLSPIQLSEDGLVPTIRAHIERLGLSVEFEAGVVGRYPAAVEEAVYYTLLEALQNALKHAGGADIHASLLLDAEGLRFIVSDDGPGFDPAEPRSGSGLGGMAERVGMHGGRLSVSSRPGAGTRVEGLISQRALQEVAS